MPDNPQPDRRERLLAHLESVYTLAQAVTPDVDHAAQLVEDTYRQALVTLPLNATEHEEKQWLFQLLMHVHRERLEFGRQDPVDSPGAPSAEAFDAFRRRLAEEVAGRTFPAVFAALPEAQRLVLLLCEVEKLSCAEASLVLDLDADAACRLLAQARAAIEAALHAGVSTHERRLLETSLPDDWLAASLRTTVASAFRTAPPTLRPAVEAATESDRPPPVHVPPSPAPVLTESRPAAPPSGASGARLRRAALVLLLIVTIGLFGYFASRALKQTPETNVITISVQQAGDLSLTFPTGSLEQAEEFVQGRFNWRLTLPTIDRASLIGVGIREPAPGVKIPVFLFEDSLVEDPAAHPIVLYVFSYALLDRYDDRIQLEPGILRQIQEEQHFDLHDLGERQVLVWRNRDDIYLAVTSGNAESLRQRILFPS